MNIAPLNPVASNPLIARQASAGSVASRFEAMLQDRHADHDEAQKAAQQIVGYALYMPMLKQMRNDPFKSDLMHGGFGEDAFANQFDQLIADRLAERSNHGLADAMVRRMTAAQTPELNTRG